LSGKINDGPENIADYFRPRRTVRDRPCLRAECRTTAARRGCSCYAPSASPYGSHRRDAADDANANEIGALAGQDFAAVVKTDGFSRSFGNGSHGRRKIDPGNALRQEERSHQ
jgi:hypothetical protein